MNYYDVIRQISQFASKSEKSSDNIFFETIVFKVTKILDPKHHNPI